VTGSSGTPLGPGDPRSLGRWTTSERIGAGGMGVVYRAESDRGEAAIKVVRPGLLDDVAVHERFAREVEVLRRVRDVHICRFLDADLIGEPAWLATAFIPGPNLKELVAENGPLPPREWWRLARGLAQALAVLEVHGIIHRDVKPANVIMSQGDPVLIDFGIANPEDASSLTATGAVAGSPSWLSPEQAELKPTTSASDAFSLGSALAFAATGRPPFGQGNTMAVLLAVSTAEPDLAGIDPDRAALLGRLLQKSPGARPDAREVLRLAKERLAAPPAERPSAAADVAGSDAETDETIAIGLPPRGAGQDQTAVLSAAEEASPSYIDLTATPTAMVPPAASTAAGAATAGAAAAVGAAAVVSPTGAGSRDAGGSPPGGAASPRRRSLWPWLLLLAVLVVGGVVGVLLLRGDSPRGDDTAVIPDEQPSESELVDGAPPAPASDQLRSGDWLLSSYRITNDNGLLGVEGTVENQGTSSASGEVRTYVYVDGQLLGVATGEVVAVPAGGSQPVSLTSEAQWRLGNPVVQLEVVE